jgi:hypothetical protein
LQGGPVKSSLPGFKPRLRLWLCGLIIDVDEDQ